MQGLIGRKIGMTRVFTDAGEQVPVTVLECGPCVVLQRKTADTDGYEAVQLGFDDQAAHRVNKPQAAVFNKLGVPCKRFLREFRLEPGDEFKAGDVVNAGIFEQATHVDITGMTKGKGFQGVMRRYRMRGGAMTHGGHSKRRIGSIGCREKPGRVYKLKRMPGHMGHLRVTQLNLRVIQVRPEENLLLVQGAVPGHAGAMVIIRRALKKGGKQ
ncbi:MAG: 50S ribosomal protein L3 [Kiritimatiellia bacterium]